MQDAQWEQYGEFDDRHRDRVALELLRKELPGHDPTRAWVGFEFIALDGANFEVDALILTEAGVFLVEVAPYRGHLDIGTDIWLQTRQNESVVSMTSPVAAARRKASKLHALLEAVSPASHRVPPIEPVVFLSELEVSVDIDGNAAASITFHPDRQGRPSIIDALLDGEAPGISRLSAPLNHLAARRFESALQEAAIEKPRYRRVGDYQLVELLDTSQHFQDYLARHRSNDELRRARIFRAPRHASKAQLARIQEAARREYELISELSHQSVLHATRHIGHETRPAVLFECPENALRLDLYMAREHNIGSGTRYAILESVAEAIRYAHEHRVIHRAISPQSVLVIPPDKPDQAPGVRLFNWHTARQEDRETGTLHVSDYLDDAGKVFLAPELATAPDVTPSADVFGLGALAYFLFTGQAPAPDLQSLVQTLADRGGLRPSAVNEKIGTSFDDLVSRATAGTVRKRLSTAEDFCRKLEAIREDLVAIEFGPQNPLEARKDDRLGTYTVIKRLGSGSTATAMLADSSDGRRVVLKIANDQSRGRRLDAEARALESLDSEIIVDLYGTTTLGGHRALITQYAGDTLLDELRKRAALSLDDQRRFGADLCQVLRDLERAGIFHRDIKPANLAIGRPRNGANRLMLFDFSLHGVDIDNLDVGTRAYRDPFLGHHGRCAWDAYADRYAAALVLHEMVTQRLPVWGDGRSHPAADASASLHLEIERFPASIRDALTDFFQRALHRDFQERFDTADEMFHRWADIYRRTEDTSHGDAALAIAEVRPDHKMSRLEVSRLALDTLETVGVSTVEDLLRLPGGKLIFLKGAGQDVRDELGALRDRLAAQFPGIVADAKPTELPDAHFEEASIERIFELLKRKPANFDYAASFTDLIGAVFCDGLPWGTVERLADALSQSPDDLRATVQELRKHWQNKQVLSPLRDDLVRIVGNMGGVVEAAELARAVLGERGSLLEGEERMEKASAVTRAAVETELASTDSRIHILRHHTGEHPAPTFIATRPELLDLIPELGRRADALASREPLASSNRTLRELAEVVDQAGLFTIANHRLLRVAAAASERAAVSSQAEIYPADMEPQRSLNLCANLLLRREPLTRQGVAAAVRDRYPAIDNIPGRPELDELLEEAGVGLEWNRSTGRYVSKYGPADLGVTRATASSFGGTHQSNLPVTDEEARYVELRSSLDFKRRDGGFFAMTVQPRFADAAARRLAAVFELQHLSIDRVVIDVLRERADARDVSWDLLLKTDSPDAPAGARQTMMRFLKGEEIADRVYQRICQASDRLLLTDPGLLGRWNGMADTMSVVDRLHSRNRSDGPSLIWLLVPQSDASGRARPRIAGAAVPVDSGDYLRLPSAIVDEDLPLLANSAPHTL